MAIKEPWFTSFKPYTGNLDQTPVQIDEYLPAGKSIVLGLQHAFAMFGATVLAPLLMGFDPNLTIFITGIGTILFFLMTGGRMPSYLGSSFASIGLIVMKTGTGWIEKLMPPIVTGAIVMIIGLNLAPVTIKSVSANSFDTWMAILTILCISAIAVFTRGMMRRLLLLLGLVCAYVLYFILANVMGFGKAIDFAVISNAAWLGLPHFVAPTFNANAMLLIAPVAIILVAENLGHFKAVSAMTGRDLSPYMGRAFFADGVCTSLSASVGGTGMTTYAENIGVMAVTKIYSTTVFVIAGIFAILLGLSPKFGAVISTIPVALLGGASIVVFGLITVAGAKIWIDNKIDFTKNSSLIIAAVSLIMGAGNFSVHIGSFDLGGIGTATLAAILLNLFLNRGEKQPDEIKLESSDAEKSLSQSS
ncbi:solute carrier family 23 protein [Acinetobacter guillouiae]|uniref:solute carrier family 23 protein n=1 Tax=Acinetobacter guillouiae TaxID=106649 RepID=UPI002E20595D|nr:solute carrier family 23 protein [Acinetobacter guillouiae]